MCALQKLALEMPCAHYDELYAQELHSPAVQEEERVNAVSALLQWILFGFTCSAEGEE